MRHLIRFALIFLLTAIASLAAQASGDAGCNPSMKVFHSDFTGCDSMGFLAPGNDTRVNLIYLMADAHHQKLKKIGKTDRGYYPPNDLTPVDWAGLVDALTPPAPTPADSSAQQTTGEGSICVSDEKGKTQFIAALMADGSVAPDVKTKLIDARNALNCQSQGDSSQMDVLAQAPADPAATDFFAYLKAITQFYKQSHTDASAFSALTNSTQPWVKEAAVYMQARVLLLNAQANAFDEYGTLQQNKIDQAAVGKALDALNAYLKDYPKGAYTGSATGLLRRAYWLGADKSKQLEIYDKLVSGGEVNESSLDIVNEMDLKVPVEAFANTAISPMLLAVQDFRRMRTRNDEKGKPVIDLKSDELEAQRPRFASQPELFEYLAAARAWLVDKDAKAVLKILPEKPVSADMSYLEFSRQLLRTAALDVTGDDTARNNFVAMFPAATSAYQRGTLELALAMYDERHKKVGPDFEAGTLIQDSSIRRQLLEYVAGPIILRQQAKSTTAPKEEREVALYRLLSRELVQGHFKGFLEDFALLPEKPVAATGTQDTPQDIFVGFRWEGRKEGYICPNISGIAKSLDANPKDIHARMCLGDFFRLFGIADATVSDKDILGGTGTLFSGAPIFRGDIYSDVIKDKSATRDDIAYALFRAVHCYEPAHSNDCGGKEVPLSVRKGWYDELKQKYGNTNWADALQYYW